MKKIRYDTGQYVLEADLRKTYDISIPLNFNGDQPNAFDVDRAKSEPCRFGDLVGDTRLGGSCNFDKVSFIPHCNGTHTEGIGHIVDERVSVTSLLGDIICAARLVTIDPVRFGDSDESYSNMAEPDDLVITAAQLRILLEADGSECKTEAVVVRTLPNSDEKQWRSYGSYGAAYFTTDAVQYLASKEISHLVCDLPSIDRLTDGGRLINHRLFWNIPDSSKEFAANSRKNCTITELAFAGDHITDGDYLLNIQIAPFSLDAAPSRPILIPVAK